MSSYYQHHVFFCLNERAPGEACCATHNAKAMQEYAKKRCKELGIAGGEGRVRINKAGCLNRCELGPVLVVYPEAVWYTFVDEQDIDEIIDSHLVHGKPVERLMVDR
ncbi:ferredoxin [Cupriavidus sp. USMAA2-4]|uniref:Ferredoxin n=1 Tax=Cupriavidus malaysiensis TaxID=367825 RepID=A0ABN4THZ8_9BURK|nr:MULTISPECIES: ferredoxin [Cupriavidus]AOY91913.1 ferredoxin [Cupriavidus sp. USMAA2-4]AOY98528.1 ferredoxin [Cupriavidus sp. USMAHM13]AOZ04958.1 ferredoxin [Cupriavidus malaysiensis]